MAALMALLWAKFETHRNLVLALTIPLLAMCICDVTNDVVVALQLGLL